ncbi:MAG: zinc ribbon domain-containing protein, partial [Desulfurococcales archaeon]|nr:zinc ribbon domain-containing protein [Desulfurococcales archaeon]
MAGKTVRCPYCGQTFSVPETVPVAVCPYCGTAVWLGTGEVFREHYMYPVRHEYNSAYKIAIGVASRQYEAPERLELDASPSAGMLHFVPLYLYRVRVRAECPGNPEAGLEESWENRLATSRPPRGLPQSYRFPTRGRRFFEPKTLERGKYYQPDVDPKSLIPEVSARASAKALREAFNWCAKPEIVDETVWQGIVHYPFWEVRYLYRGEEYYALVDAAGGWVVYLEYPVGSAKRATLMAA